MSVATIVVLLMVAALLAGTRQQRSWGTRLLERVNRLEERIDRLAVGDRTGRDDHHADELLRLEERVDFLERLLEERPRTGALPKAKSGEDEVS